MKTKTGNMVPESLPLSDGDGSGSLLKCDDIQMLLFAYMTRELGDVQSRVVREHLRTCDACRREAADIRETLDMLKADADETKTLGGEHLSDERRKRILRAVFHPVMDWIDCHHRMVSISAAVLLLALVLFLLRNAAIFRPEPLEEGIPAWRMFKSGPLPEGVGQEQSPLAPQPPPATPGQETEEGSLPRE